MVISYKDMCGKSYGVKVMSLGVKLTKGRVVMVKIDVSLDRIKNHHRNKPLGMDARSL